MDSSSVRFALVAGEPSGDILGAELLIALKKHFPLATFEGIGGEKMKAQGFHSIFPLERLSVMGLWEPLKRLPELISIRWQLKSYFIKQKPTVFIGIDAPDFNLGLEKSLKKNGIPTVHYVSPTIWAWRKGRVHTIKKAIDLMLTIFPFETKIYEENKIPFCFVGHPLADKISFHSDKLAARLKLNIPLSAKVVALLPGSRAQELRYLAKDFIQTAQWLKKNNKNQAIHFIANCVNQQRYEQLQKVIQEEKLDHIQLFLGKTHEVIASSDAVLAASGTVTLESMLIKRPTIVAYKMSSLTYWLLKRLINVPYISLPNLLANKCLMPELIQEDATPQKMGERIQHFLSEPSLAQKLLTEFEKIHLSLKKNASETAALAIMDLIGKNAVVKNN